MKRELEFRWRGSFFWGRRHRVTQANRGWACTCGWADRDPADHIKQEGR